MNNIIDMVANHYLIFTIITIILIFALIGYFVARSREKNSQFKIDNSNKKAEEINVNNLEINKNTSLQDLVKDNATIKKDGPESL